MKQEKRRVAQHGCSVSEFLQTVSTPCLSVYDTRRGSKEGQEADKVLCFHPEWASTNVRTSLVGLAQALTSFSASFGADETSEHVMDAKHHRWVLVQCEPHIWLLMVAKKSWLGGTCTDSALRHFLRMVHAQHLLLQDPIACTLEQDPSGSMARHALQPLMSEMGARLACADTLEAASLGNPLGQVSTHMPLLPTPTPAFLSVQCLVSALLQLLPHPKSAQATHPAQPPFKQRSTLREAGTPPFKHTAQPTAAEAGLPLQGAMVLWHGRPVWSTLPLQDGVAAYHFAQRALIPHVEGGKRCTKLLRSLAVTAAIDCQASRSAAAAEEQQAGPEQHDSQNTHIGASAAAAGDASQGGCSPSAGKQAPDEKLPPRETLRSSSPSTLLPTSAPASAAAKLARGKMGLHHPPPICHACYDTLLCPNRWGVVGFLEACRVRNISSSNAAGSRNEEGGARTLCAGQTAATAAVPAPAPQAQAEAQAIQQAQAQALQAEQVGHGHGSISEARKKEGTGEGADSADGCEAHSHGVQSRGSDPAEPKPVFTGSGHAVVSGSGSDGKSRGGEGSHGSNGGGSNDGSNDGGGNANSNSAGGTNPGDGGFSSWKDMVANAGAQASTALGSAATTFSALMGAAPSATPMSPAALAASTSLGPAARTAPNPSHQHQQPHPNLQKPAPAQVAQHSTAQHRLRQPPVQHHREHHLSGFLCPCPPPSGMRAHAVASTGGPQSASLPPHALPLEPAASVDDSLMQGAAPAAATGSGDGAEQQAGVTAACVWMQGMQRHCVLLPAFRGPLLVLMLLQTDRLSPSPKPGRASASVPNTVAVSPECLQAIVEVLAQHVPPTSGRLAAGVPAQDLWHCPGFRYCHEDGTCAATRCTPAEKVPTLSSSALKLTAHVRDRLQHLEHTAKLQGVGGSEGGAQEVCDSTLDEFDFMCRTGQGSWITARHAAPRQTLVALEAHAPTSLAEAAAHAHRLYDTVARGYYAGLG